MIIFRIHAIIVYVITGDALSYTFKWQLLIILCRRYALRMHPVAMCMWQRRMGREKVCTTKLRIGQNAGAVCTKKGGFIILSWP